MKAAALLVVLCSTIVSAGIGNVFCYENPREWGRSNCSGDDIYACEGACVKCRLDIDKNGHRGFWYGLRPTARPWTAERSRKAEIHHEAREDRGEASALGLTGQDGVSN
ncbi:hypothetical protein CMUS01_08208 [Colletotrichum musicola]|uniref:Secreted protein n=1 Tax=Colletotrichum musicola TaxID=2175873 RepID=A0A8H6KDX3_9PEZI|nr:hypothetical protein CMUS01_08208 [Colletotrichum musicola]